MVNPTVPRRSRDLLEQHDMLRQKMRELDEMLHTEFDWEPLELELVRLEAILVRHFTLEEEDGYLSEVEARTPTAAPDLSRLQDEHGQLRSGLRRIRHFVVDREGRIQVREAMADWITQLRRHESDETKLIQEAFNLELGVSD